MTNIVVSRNNTEKRERCALSNTHGHTFYEDAVGISTSPSSVALVFLFPIYIVIHFARL